MNNKQQQGTQADSKEHQPEGSLRSPQGSTSACSLVASVFTMNATCADTAPVVKQEEAQQLTQHDPHDAWSLTGLSAPEPLQSTVVGSMCSGTLGLCISACLPSRGNAGLALPWLGSMVAKNSSLCQSANLLMARLCHCSPWLLCSCA